jgi:hypothetical protein
MRTWANTPAMRDAYREWYESTGIKDQTLANCWQAAWNAALKKRVPSKQQDLFGVSSLAFARSTDPDTSQDAAKSFDPNAMESKVLQVIQSYGQDGCIKDQILQHFPADAAPTVTPRIAPLMRKGWIEDTGERRKGHSGRNQRVHRAIR